MSSKKAEVVFLADRSNPNSVTRVRIDGTEIAVTAASVVTQGPTIGVSLTIMGVSLDTEDVTPESPVQGG